MGYEVEKKELPKFRIAIKDPMIVRLINDNLGDKEVARKFIADITSVVNQNPSLQDCSAISIISAGFVANSINLPLSPALSFSYVVPRNVFDKTLNRKVWKAQFQISWKGLVQLAIRSGYYQDIGTQDIREGELHGLDEFTGEPKFRFWIDDKERLKHAIIGYRAYFVLNAGFKKQVYWSNEKLKQHAKTYSKSYETGKSTDLWSNNFDIMARKTVLRNLLTQFGIMSVEMRDAIKNDQAVIEKDKISYIDNPKDEASNDYEEPITDEEGEIKPTKEDLAEKDINTPETEKAPINEAEDEEAIADKFAELREQVANKNAK